MRQMPSGTSRCSGEKRNYTQPEILPPTVTGVTWANAPELFASNFPNPFRESTTITYRLRSKGEVSIRIFDGAGNLLETIAQETLPEGEYSAIWNAGKLPAGTYFAAIELGSRRVQTLRLTLID